MEIQKASQDLFGHLLQHDQRAQLCRFLKGYAASLKLLAMGEAANQSQVFSTFMSECFSPFQNHLLQADHFDGMWVGPLLDHLTHILCELAFLADAQASEKGQDSQFDAGDNDDDDDEEDSDQRFTR